MMTVRVLILNTSFSESVDVTELTPEDTVGRVKAVVEGRCRHRTPAATPRAESIYRDTARLNRCHLAGRRRGQAEARGATSDQA